MNSWTEEELKQRLAENPALKIALQSTRKGIEARTGNKHHVAPKKDRIYNGVLMIRESDFLQQIIDLAHLKGWRVAHFRPARKQDGTWVTPMSADGKGFPDLIFARNGVVICAEVKSEMGKLSKEQREWQTELGALSVGVWRPADWERIVAILT